MSEFKVGVEVEWTSSSNGSTKTKRGRIEVVVPKGRRAKHRRPRRNSTGPASRH